MVDVEEKEVEGQEDELDTENAGKGSEDAEGKEEEGVEDEAGKGGEGEPTAKDGQADGELRAELVKRFGEKSDQEYIKEVWKAYRNMESEFGKKQDVYTKLDALIDKLGGPEALESALMKSPSAATEKVEDKTPAELKELIDSGYLEPNDPKDALLMTIVKRQMESDQERSLGHHEKAKAAFEGGLKDVAKEFPNADIDSIRMLGYSGAFKDLPDGKMWATVRNLAKQQNEKVEGMVKSKEEGLLKKLKGLGEGSILKGKTTASKPGKKSSYEAFDEAWRKHHGPGEE